MSKKSCIIFDFDCTITQKHLYYLLNESKVFMSMYNVPEENHNEVYELASKINNGNTLTDNQTTQFINLIFGGTERLAMLKNFLSKCLNNGLDLYISSRGFLSDITQSLLIVGLLNYFCCIHSTLDKAIYYPYFNKKIKFDHGKDIFIMNLMDGAFMGQYDNLFYIDDTHTEHKKLCTIFNVINKENDIDIATIVSNGVIKYYTFIGSIIKDVGGGISNTDIKLFESAYKTITSKEFNQIINNLKRSK